MTKWSTNSCASVSVSLPAFKSQNGAAMSFGRTATFIDIYIERDLKAGKLTETEHKN